MAWFGVTASHGEWTAPCRTVPAIQRGILEKMLSMGRGGWGVRRARDLVQVGSVFAYLSFHGVLCSGLEKTRSAG